MFTKQYGRLVFRCIALVGLAVLLAVSASIAAPTYVYTNDFENGVDGGIVASGVTAGWSAQNMDATPLGARHFLGQFGQTDGTRLDLSGLPAHVSVTVSFDLYIINSWDGDDPDTGLDGFNVTGPNGILFDHTFAVHEDQTQSYPSSQSPANTGSVEVNQLGYDKDAVYHITLTFDSYDSQLFLDFASYLSEELANESWGIDNVVVSVASSGIDINPTSLHAATARGEVVDQTLTVSNPGDCNLYYETYLDSPASSRMRWTPTAEAPGQMSHCAVDPSTGIIYAFTTEDESFYQYDPNTDEWEPLPPCPFSLGQFGGACYLKGKIYISSGDNLLGGMAVYDIGSYEWSVKPNYVGVPMAVLGTDGEYIYSTGSMSEAEASSFSALDLRPQNIVESLPFVRYSPESDTWEPLADIPVYAANWGGLDRYGDYLYVATSTGDGRSLLLYSLTDNTWYELEPSPAPMSIGGVIYPEADSFVVFGQGEFQMHSLWDDWWDSVVIPGLSEAYYALGMAYSPSPSPRVYVASDIGFGYVDAPQWLSLSSSYGTIPPGQSEDITTTFDATNLSGGTYYANIWFGWNDTNYSWIRVPVQFDVDFFPEISVSTNSLNFGSVWSGQSATRSFTVENNGVSVLNVTNVSCANTGVTASPSVFTIWPNEEQVVTVTYSPTAAETLSDDLVISSNDPTSPSVLINVTGSALDSSTISVNPDHFEKTMASGTVETDNLSITNNGPDAFNYSLELSLEGHASGTDTWVPLTPPTRLSSVAVDQSSGMVYAQASWGSSAFYRYDPRLNTWTSLAGCPIYADYGGAATCFGGKVYVTGDYSGYLGIYNIASNSWTTVNNNIGGTTMLTNDGSYVYLANSAGVKRYDPATSNITSLPYPIWSPNSNYGALAYLDGKLYLGGDYNWGGTFGRLDLNSSIWTMLPYASSWMMGAAADPSAKAVYLFNSYNRLGRYNVGENSINYIPLPNVNTSYSTSLAYGNAPSARVYVAFDSGGFGYLDLQRWLRIEPNSGTVPPGETASLTATFDTTGVVEGNYSGNIVVRDAGLSAAIKDVPVLLHVTGIPDIAVSPSESISFGSVFVGFPWEHDLVLTNRGTGLLTAQIACSNPLITLSDATVNIAPYDSLTVSVTYTPDAVGSLDSALTITSNDLDTPTISLPLTGSAFLPPVLAVDPTTISQSLEVGTTVDRTVNISNTGSSQLSFNASTSGLSFISISPSSGEVEAGSSVPLTLTINASGRSIDHYDGNIQITSNDPAHVQTNVPVAVDVWGLPRLIVDPATIDFGIVFLGVTGTRTFTVSNTRTAALNVSSIVSDNPTVTISPTNFIIDPGQNNVITVHYTPSQYETMTANLTITSNDPDNGTVTVPMTGSCAPPPTVSVAPSSLQQSVEAGAIAHGSITINNTGGSDLTYTTSSDYMGFTEPTSLDIATSAVQSMQQFSTFGQGEKPKSSAEVFGVEVTGPPCVALGGGPDAGGYRWKGSSDVGGPAFNWIDILSTGHSVTGLFDDSYQGPFEIGFPFKYYGNTYTQFYISSNGYIGFGPPNGYSSYGATGIPNSSTPNNVIYWNWADLYQWSGTSYVHYQTKAQGLVVQFTNYGWYSSGEPVTAEIVLKTNNEILLQYLTPAPSREGVIGIENSTGTSGIWINSAGRYTSPNTAIRFYRYDWLSTDPASGTVPPGGSATLDVVYNATDLVEGDYTGEIEVRSNDPVTPVVSTPAALHVGGIPRVAVNPTALTLSNVLVGESTDLQFAVSNPGSGRLTVSGITTNNSELTVNPTTFSIAPLGSQNVTLHYTPTQGENLVATVTITSDADNAPTLDVPVTGAALDLRNAFVYYAYNPDNAGNLTLSGYQNNTSYAIVNLDNGALLTTGSINKGEVIARSMSGVRYFKVLAASPLQAYLGYDCCGLGGSTTYTTTDGFNKVGRNFDFAIPVGGIEFYVFAYEAADVTITNTAGATVTTFHVNANSYWRTTGAPLSAGVMYSLSSTGNVMLQTNTGNGETSIPSATVGEVGRKFLFATNGWGGGAFAVMAYEDSLINVSDIDTGQMLETNRPVNAGEYYYRGGIGTRHLKLETDGRVALWTGDCEGGSSITLMGDDNLATSGRDNREFYVHTQNYGAYVFAAYNDTQVTVNGAAQTINADGHFSIPAGNFVHIVASKPIMVHTVGGNGLNDWGEMLIASRQLGITCANPPIANAGMDRDAFIGQSFQFDGSGSSGAITLYEWDLNNDGTPDMTGVNPTHVFDAPYEGDIRLTVTSDAGCMSTDTMHLVVRNQVPFDLSVWSPEVSITPVSPIAGGVAVQITAVIRNTSDVDGTCDLRAYKNTPEAANLIGEVVGTSIGRHNHVMLTIPWDTTGLDAPFNVLVQIENASHVESSTDNNLVTLSNYEIMTNPPVITDLLVSPASNHAYVTWTTDKRSTSVVQFWPAGNPGATQTVSDSSYVTGHVINLTSLTPNAGYEFRVRSADPVGHEGVSQVGSFTAVEDTVAPDTWFTQTPQNNVACSLPVSLAWSGHDDTAGTNLTYSYKVDQGAWSAFSASTSTSISSLTEGAHTIAVKAQDPYGNVDQSPASVVITLDTTGPAIANVTSIPDTTTCVIRWNTDDATTEQVEYSTDQSFSSHTNDSATWRTAHEMTLTGLVPNTTYNYRVKSRDGCNRTTTSAAGTFTTLPAPNLAVTIESVPVEGWANRSIDVTYTVTNDTNVPITHGFSDKIYISTDNQISHGTEIGRFEVPDGLAAHGSYTHTHTVTIPALIQGQRWIIVKTDTESLIEEVTEADNIAASQPMTIRIPPYPDLRITSVTGTLTSPAGGQIALSWTEKNDGTGGTDAPVWYDRVYLSSTPNMTGKIADLTEFENESSLAPTESYIARDKLVTIPGNVSGDYYLVVKADSRNQVAEYRADGDAETNNTNAYQIRVTYVAPASLSVSSVVVDPNPCYAGESVNVTWTVQNQGDVPTGPFESHDAIGLLPTANYTGAMQQWHIVTSGNLAPGETYTNSRSYSIPQSASGTWYMFAATDLWQHTGLVQGVNNCAVEIIASTPADLEVPSVTSDVTGAEAGTSIPIHYTVLNSGADSTRSGSWSDAVYLSRNTVLDATGDLYLTSFGHSGDIAPDDQYIKNTSVSIPVGVSGDWYLLVKADSNNQVWEGSGEGNNVGYSAMPLHFITHQPDLSVLTTTAPTVAFSGSNIELTWQTKNVGDVAAAGSWNDTVYLSADATINPAGDRVIGTFPHTGGLDHQAFYDQPQSVTLPGDVGGSCFVYVQTDSNNAVNEYMAEDNNIGPAAPINITRVAPDLQTTSVQNVRTAKSGSTVSVTWTVTNKGTSATLVSQWVDSVYFSTDNNLNKNQDYLAAKVPHTGALDINAPYTVTSRVDVPISYEGQYWVFVCADGDNAVGEFALENNNCNYDQGSLIISRGDLSDLNVTEILPSGQAVVNQPLSVTWTVKNSGAAATNVSAWKDELFISTDMVLSSNDKSLSLSPHAGTLDKNDTYQLTATPTLPTGITGDVYLIVATDRQNAVFEGDETNNYTPLPIHVSLYPANNPDLRVDSVNVTGSDINAGQPVHVEWQVSNQGNAPAQGASWADTIYLCASPTLDLAHDIPLGNKPHSASLAQTDHYNETLDVTLPLCISGQYYIVVYTDSTSRIVEAESENNNTNNFGPINVQGSPVADLRVTSVGAPAEAIAGQPISLSWQVDNAGSASTGVASWVDKVVLSKDRIIDSTDTTLGFLTHEGELVNGTPYQVSHSFDLPRSAAGPYYILVLTDSNDKVEECVYETNNIGCTATATMVALAPLADLVVTNVTIPTTAKPGDTVQISFTVTNQGANPTPDSWSDAVYLSANGSWDIGDLPVGRVSHSGSLNPGASYAGTLTAIMPGASVGSYKAIVRADIRNVVRESDETNNMGVSAAFISLDVTALTLGQPYSDSITTGAQRYYRVTVPKREDMRISLTCENSDASNEMYIRFGDMPDLSHYDFTQADPFVASQDITVSGTFEGTYYIMVRGASVPGGTANYAIKAELLSFGLRSVSPEKAGNAGSTTVTVEGAKFSTNTTVTLVKNGLPDIPASKVQFATSSKIYATFDLAGKDAAKYDVVATDQAYGSASLPEAFEVTAGRGASVYASIVLPQAVSPDREFTAWVRYGNSGDADARAPIFVINGPSGLLLKTQRGAEAGKEHIQILGVDPIGLAGVLPPGASNAIPIYFVPNRTPGTMHFSLRTESGRNEPMDWDSIEPTMKPPTMSTDAWNTLWATFRAQVGDTWSDYVDMLDRNATRLSLRGKLTYRLEELLGFEMLKASGKPMGAISGTVRDADTGQLLSGIELAAWNSDPAKSGRGITDTLGWFNIDKLATGHYELYLNGYQFVEPVSVDLPADGDVSGLNLYARAYKDEGPLPVSQANDSAPVAFTDSAGAMHMLWWRDGKAWHAINTGSGWTMPGKIGDATGSNLAGVAGATLSNGGPGVFATWQTGFGNEARIVGSVGHLDNGTFVWTNPRDISADNVGSTDPAVTLGSDSVPVVLLLKKNWDIQDDSDLYYATPDPAAFNGIWVLAMVPKSSLGASPMGITGEICEQVKIETGKCLPSWVPIIGGKYKFAVAGEFCGIRNCDKVQLAGTIGGELQLTDYVSGGGQAGGSAVWAKQDPPCAYVFDAATLKGKLTGSGDIPCIPFVVLGCQAELGAHIEGEVGLEAEWKGVGFPGWPSNLTGSLKVGAGPYGKVKLLGGILEAKVGGTGSVSAKLDYTGFHWGDVCVKLYAEAHVGWLTGGLSYEWCAPLETTSNAMWMMNDPTFRATDIDNNEISGGVTVKVEANPGTGSVYGANTVLSDVTSDLYNDDNPTVATGPDGEVLAVWAKDTANPNDHLGSAIVAATKTATGWESPVTIAPDTSFNRQPALAFDGTIPVIAWATAPANVTLSSTGDEVVAAMSATNIMVSRREAGSWSTPVQIAGLEGKDDQITIAAANSKLVVAWVNSNSGTDSICASIYDGGTWSAPVVIASGTFSGKPAAGFTNGTAVVVWSQLDTAINAYRLFQSSLTSGAWTHPDAIVAPTMASEESITNKTNSRALVPQNYQLCPRIDGRVDSTAVQRMTAQGKMITKNGIQIGAPDKSCCKDDDDDDDDPPDDVDPPTPPCDDDGSCEPSDDDDTNNTTRMDPNDKIGPSGYGEDAFVAARQPMPYTIDFENVPTATAPVQVVRVTDQLDANVDWRSFRLGDMGFGKYVIPVPTGRCYYRTKYQLGADLNNLVVDVDAGIDITTGMVHWTLTTIDPLTGERPENPLLGFLLPDDAEHLGQGYVQYTVKPKTGIPTGSLIKNKGTIFFDEEAPIETNETKNTVDAVSPSSEVAALPETTQDTSFIVNWSGSDDDGGSGVANYSIYVADNDGPYALWMKDSTDTQASYTGVPGHSYKFYSVAKDNAGNEEALPPAEDAKTTLASNTPSNPHPADGAHDVPINTSFSWTGSESTVAYDLYLWKENGSKPTLPTVVDLTTSAWTPSGPLDWSTGYLWQVIAKRSGGETAGPNWAFWTQSSPTAPQDAKGQRDGATVTLSDCIVTAVFGNAFYIQRNQISGIRVESDGACVSVGDKLEVEGVMKTSDIFERYIQTNCTKIHHLGTGLIEPMFMTLIRAIGGANTPDYDPSTGVGQRGVENASPGGVNTIGLFVKIYGRVTGVGKDYFYVDDANRKKDANDGSVFRGIRIRCGSMTKPSRNQMVMVTGISSIMRGGDKLFRSLIPRVQEDIVIVVD